MARNPRGTHLERILSWAQAGRVIHQDDWYNAGADGGPPIKAVRSRISDLEHDGYGFHHTTRPDGTVEYRLAYAPPPRPPAESVVDFEDLGEQLGLALPPAPLNAALTDWDGDE